MNNMIINILITKILIKSWKSCSVFLAVFDVFCFLNAESLTFHPAGSPIFQKQLIVGWLSMLPLLSLDLYLRYVVETYAVNTYWKRCYLRTPFCLIQVCFTNQKPFQLISTEIKKFKFTHFSVKNYFDCKILLTKFCI